MVGKYGRQKMANRQAGRFKLDYMEVPDATLVTGEGPLGTCGWYRDTYGRRKCSSAHGVSKKVTESILYDRIGHQYSSTVTGHLM